MAKEKLKGGEEIAEAEWPPMETAAGSLRIVKVRIYFASFTKIKFSPFWVYSPRATLSSSLNPLFGVSWGCDSGRRQRSGFSDRYLLAPTCKIGKEFMVIA